jgi:hypothetical protein
MHRHLLSADEACSTLAVFFDSVRSKKTGSDFGEKKGIVE